MDVPALAIRLELTEVEQRDEVIHGRAQGRKVELSGRSLRMTLTHTVPFREILAKSGELRLDEVETGDAGFDLAVSVRSEPHARMSTRELLSDARLRANIRALLSDYPAVRIGSNEIVTVGGDLSKALRLALAIDAGLSAAKVPPPPAPAGGQTKLQQAWDRRRSAAAVVVAAAVPSAWALAAWGAAAPVLIGLIAAVLAAYVGLRRCPRCGAFGGAGLPRGHCGRCSEKLERPRTGRVTLWPW